MIGSGQLLSIIAYWEIELMVYVTGDTHADFQDSAKKDLKPRKK